jgi:hypothetical protein
MTYDPKYKLSHKPPPVSRLAHYKHFPPPMVGDPRGHFKDWDTRCRAIYNEMMRRQRGLASRNEMHGLWFWDYRAQHEMTCFELVGRL